MRRGNRLVSKAKNIGEAFINVGKTYLNLKPRSTFPPEIDRKVRQSRKIEKSDLELIIESGNPQLAVCMTTLGLTEEMQLKFLGDYAKSITKQNDVIESAKKHVPFVWKVQVDNNVLENLGNHAYHENIRNGIRESVKEAYSKGELPVVIGYPSLIGFEEAIKEIPESSSLIFAVPDKESNNYYGFKFSRDKNSISAQRVQKESELETSASLLIGSDSESVSNKDMVKVKNLITSTANPPEEYKAVTLLNPFDSRVETPFTGEEECSNKFRPARVYIYEEKQDGFIDVTPRKPSFFGGGPVLPAQLRHKSVFNRVDVRHILNSEYYFGSALYAVGKGLHGNDQVQLTFFEEVAENFARDRHYGVNLDLIVEEYVRHFPDQGVICRKIASASRGIAFDFMDYCLRKKVAESYSRGETPAILAYSPLIGFGAPHEEMPDNSKFLLISPDSLKEERENFGYVFSKNGRSIDVEFLNDDSQIGETPLTLIDDTILTGRNMLLVNDHFGSVPSLPEVSGASALYLNRLDGKNHSEFVQKMEIV